MEAKTQLMKPGDILVYWGTIPGEKGFVPSHIALALNDGMILHNTIAKGPGFAGVVKHKADTAVKPYLGYQGTKIEVFRLEKDEQLAKSAADFGEKWAAPEIIDSGNKFRKVKLRDHGKDPSFTKPDFDFKPLTEAMNPWLATEEKPVDFKALGTNKSPYSTGRLELGQKSDLQSWTVLSAFRAVKAVVRASTNQGLSPRHGTSCDQFVMYCYQAASVAKFSGDHLDQKMIESMQTNPKMIKLYFSSQEPSKELAEDLSRLHGPAWDELKKLLESMSGNELSTGFLPQELASDAKTSSVKKLFEKIGAEGSGFKFIGKLDADAHIVESERSVPQMAPTNPKEEKK